MGAQWQKPVGRGEFRGALDVTLDLPLASIGTRGLACLLDYLILIVVLTAVALVAVFVGAGFPGAGGIVIALTLLTMFVVQWGYFFLFEWLMDGQTPGKKYMDLRVVTAEGGSPGVVSAFVRNALRVVDILPSAYGIGILTLLASSRSQRVGDLAAGTLVITELGQAHAAHDRQIPAGMQVEHVALVEAYFDRVPYLEEDRLVYLATRLLEMLRAVYPDTFTAGATDYRADVELERLFPRRASVAGATIAPDAPPAAPA